MDFKPCFRQVKMLVPHWFLDKVLHLQQITISSSRGVICLSVSIGTRLASINQSINSESILRLQSPLQAIHISCFMEQDAKPVCDNRSHELPKEHTNICPRNVIPVRNMPWLHQNFLESHHAVRCSERLVYGLIW